MVLRAVLILQLDRLREGRWRNRQTRGDQRGDEAMSVNLEIQIGLWIP